jgi:hypothetical protein
MLIARIRDYHPAHRAARFARTLRRAWASRSSRATGRLVDPLGRWTVGATPPHRAQHRAGHWRPSRWCPDLPGLDASRLPHQRYALGSWKTARSPAGARRWPDWLRTGPGPMPAWDRQVGMVEMSDRLLLTRGWLKPVRPLAERFAGRGHSRLRPGSSRLAPGS